MKKYIEIEDKNEHGILLRVEVVDDDIGIIIDVDDGKHSFVIHPTWDDVEELGKWLIKERNNG